MINQSLAQFLLGDSFEFFVVFLDGLVYQGVEVFVKFFFFDYIAGLQESIESAGVQPGSFYFSHFQLFPFQIVIMDRGYLDFPRSEGTLCLAASTHRLS